MIKEAAMELLRCSTKTTGQYRKVQRIVRTFVFLGFPIISQKNKCVDEIRILSDGVPLGLRVRKSIKNGYV